MTPMDGIFPLVYRINCIFLLQLLEQPGQKLAPLIYGPI